MALKLEEPPLESQPHYGRRLLPSIIDERASREPNRIYCYLPWTSNLRHGFRSVSYRCFANAIDACAWWIDRVIGNIGSSTTLAYFGPSDLRNIIVIVAATKAGCKALLLSPRNSLKANLKLLNDTQCAVVLTSDPRPKAAELLLAQRPLTAVVLPSLEFWLCHPTVIPYQYVKTFDQARYEPLVVVHTSGSTGLPKAVFVNHGTVAANDAFNEDEADANRVPMLLDTMRGKHTFVSMPLFHIAGIDNVLVKAVFQDVIPILGHPGVPVTADFVDAMHQVAMVEMSVVAPSILQDIVASPALSENLSCLDAICYGGGSLSPSVGAAVITRTKLFNVMGSSEMACVPTEEVDHQCWEYLKFSPKLGYEMRKYSDDLFELCFIHKPHLDRFQSIFSTFPGLHEYSTKDLYSRHPTISDLWKYAGRSDDIMVLSNGEKVNPIWMENLIAAHRDVQSALVVGHARFQTALLVEPKEQLSSETDKISFVNKLWPTVQEANAQCETHARISRGLLILTSSEKPFLRAGKGTVQRKMTVNSYHDEIENAYNMFEAPARPSKLFEAPMKPVPVSGHIIDMDYKQTWLKRKILTVTEWAEVGDHDNFFSLGMDSLQVINLVHVLNESFVETSEQSRLIIASIIYENPTLTLLAKALGIRQNAQGSKDLENSNGNTDNAAEMQGLFLKYTWDLPITCRPPRSLTVDESMCIILTGSTSSIGSYVLDSLLANPRVTHIYCLNRSANAEERQRVLNAARGSIVEWSFDRVSFLQSDLAREYLGFEADTYRSLLCDVTHIIHNAWEVNFNLPLASFEIPHLLGVRQLIDFSARSAKGASILYVSSVSSAMNWSTKDSSLVPEYIFDDPSVSLPMGYAQSKHIAERILDQAAKVAGLRTTICRVGQVAGPVGQSGIWNRREWLPSLIASSKYLRKIPVSLEASNNIDWIPVDILSQVLVELMVNSSSIAAPITHKENRCVQVNGCSSQHDSRAKERQDRKASLQLASSAVYHAVNPRRTTWSILLPVIIAHFHDPSLEVVTLSDWVDALHTSSSRIEDIHVNPAAKLLDFYRKLASGIDSGNSTFEIAGAVGKSKELARLEAVKPEWMKTWLDQWNF
ncbi:MAG: hypothetical protein Q9212_004940 [Teloschistes hypoglaucus]